MSEAPASASFPTKSRLISGVRIQKLSPLPVLIYVSRFGSISAEADWQGLDAPFIVELFMLRFFGGCPKRISASADLRCRSPTPDASMR